MRNIKVLKEKVKNLKLLFVDDEEAIRNGMMVLLKKFFDDVIICSNGEEGLETFVKNGNFDIVITDIFMPKMDGIEMIKRIREIQPNIFTVFLSATRDIRDLEGALNIMVIQKPFSFDDIIKIIQRLGELK